MSARSTRYGVAAAAVALLLSACGDDAGSTSDAGSSAGGSPAETVTIKIAEYNDPGYAALLYPVMKGLVEADGVDVQIDLLPVPGLIQAVSTQQYDLINSAAIAVPRLAAGGVPIRVVEPDTLLQNGVENYAIVTKADSGITDFADLRGKRLGVEAVAATNTLQLRLALSKQAGLDVATEQGDITFVETPAAQMQQLLDAGDIDAMYLYGPALFNVIEDDNYRGLGSPQEAYGSEYDTEILVSTLVSFENIIAAKGDAIEATTALLRESVEYALAHKDEIYPVIEKEYSLPAGYLDWALEYTVAYPEMTDEELVDALTTLYDGAAEIGALESVPDVGSLIVASDG
jgi:NitT/TauT family transport system substrate-binding protein